MKKPLSRDADRDRRVRLYWSATDWRKRKRARRIHRQIVRNNNAVLRAHFTRIGTNVQQLGYAFQRATATGGEFNLAMQRMRGRLSQRHRVPLDYVDDERDDFIVASPAGSREEKGFV